MASLVSLDLPRDQLLGWIGKQLSSGFRSCVSLSTSDEFDSSNQIDSSIRILELKRKILKTSRQIGEKFNSAVSEEWRRAELKHMLLKAEIRLQKLRFQRKCLSLGDWVEVRQLRAGGNGRLIELTGDGYSEIFPQYIEKIDLLSIEIQSVWEKLNSKFASELNHRSKEEEAMKKSFQELADKSISQKRNFALEDNLHERFLLKQLKENRRKQEESLRVKIANFSAQLHSVRDLGRIKQESENAKNAQIHRHVEANERMLEWQLMEQQIRLEQQLSEIDEKFESKIKRCKNEIFKLRNVAQIEHSFVKEKDDVINLFKSEISNLRRDIRDIESATSQFRAALRKEDKARRDQAKVLRNN